MKFLGGTHSGLSYGGRLRRGTTPGSASKVSLSYRMSPTNGIFLNGLFFPSSRPFPRVFFFFLPRPQVPMKGGGAPILGDPPPRLPILGAPLSVIPLITSRASGIPMLAKILPIPFPTCFGVTLKAYLSNSCQHLPDLSFVFLLIDEQLMLTRQDFYVEFEIIGLLLFF